MSMEYARDPGGPSPLRRLWNLARLLDGMGVLGPDVRALLAKDEPTMRDCYALYQSLSAMTPTAAVAEPVGPVVQVLFNVRYAAMLLYHLGAQAPAPLHLLTVAERRAVQLTDLAVA